MYHAHISKGSMKIAHHLDDHKDRVGVEKSILATDLQWLSERAFKATEVAVKRTEENRQKLSKVLSTHRKNVILRNSDGCYCYSWDGSTHLFVGQWLDLPRNLRKKFFDVSTIDITFVIEE